MAVFDFGQRLAELRKKARLPQKQLGQRIGKSTSTIGYYERDLTLPPLDTLISISENISRFIGLFDIWCAV